MEHRLYKQVKAHITRDWVDTGDGNEPRRLPGERELQDTYGVSRQTIRKALAELAAEGRLLRTPGSSSLVLPNHRGGVSTRTGDFGRLLGYVAPIPSHPVTQRTLRGVEAAAGGRGYRVLFATAGATVAEEGRAVRDLIQVGAVGVIVSPICRRTEDLEADYLTALDLGAPAVLVDTALPEHPHPKVQFDNYRASRDLVSELHRRGHHCIACCTYSERYRHPALAERVRGYEAAVRTLELAAHPSLIHRFEPPIEAHELDHAVRTWGKLPCRPTAVLAAEDLTAIALIEAFEREGLRAPEDVTVVGWDNLDGAAHFRPRFPTTNPDFERLGEIACEHLLARLEGKTNSPGLYQLAVELCLDTHDRARERAKDRMAQGQWLSSS